MTAVKSWVLSILVLLGACIVSLVLAFSNEPYFNLVNSFFYAEGAVERGLLFSSFLLIIGFFIVVWKPRFYGFQAGDAFRHWLTVLAVLASMCAFTAIALSLVSRTPYSGANWFNELVLVPLSEETIWRGVLFSLLIVILNKLHKERTAIILTVIYSSIAFGIAHSGNITQLPIMFVLMQMIFAAITGLTAGYLRYKTKSIYPAMLLHAAINLIAILF